MAKIINQTIKEVRPMTAKEMEAEYWDCRRPPTVIILENGTKLYASRDEEGNGPGALFGVDNKGNSFGM